MDCSAEERDHVRARADTAMRNEVLCKFLAHNLCVVHQSQCELGIEGEFWPGENKGREEGPMILKMRGSEVRRLPWGVYLALWSWGSLLAVSWLPGWSVPDGFFRVGNFWQFLASLFSPHSRVDPVEGGALLGASHYLPGNVVTTVSILALGAALGAWVRFVCWQAHETKQHEMKRNSS